MPTLTIFEYLSIFITLISSLIGVCFWMGAMYQKLCSLDKNVATMVKNHQVMDEQIEAHEIRIARCEDHVGLSSSQPLVQ